MFTSTDINFAHLMVPVALHLLGEPNKSIKSRNELRWGNKGSFAVKPVAGTWYDHERGQGGGILDLIARETRKRGAEAMEWLYATAIASGVDFR